MYPKNNNKAFPIKGLSDVQQKLFGFENFDHGKANKKISEKRSKAEDIQTQFDVGDYKDPEIILPKEYKTKYFLDENGVLGSLNPVCSHCNSRNIVQWGLYSKDVISEQYCGEIILQRYQCKKCNKTFITNIKEQYNLYSNISNSLKHKALEIKELNWSSLRDISKYYEIFYNIKISHETIRKALLVVEGNEINYKLDKLSGYYGYDAQWIKINAKWIFRHAIYDTVQKMPIAEIFAEEELNEDVYYLINKYIPPIKRLGIVTDTKSGYNSIMSRLDFKQHQYCVFHFKLNLNKRVRKEINDRKTEIQKILKKTHENKSESFYNDEADKILKPLKKEIKYALQFIYQLFKQESYSKAESYILLIKTNKINFPDFIMKYIDEHLFPYYKSYIGFLKKRFNGNLDYTNNKTEGYFRATLPKGQKRKFRTLEGAINQIYHRGNGLIKNQKEKMKKK